MVFRHVCLEWLRMLRNITMVDVWPEWSKKMHRIQYASENQFYIKLLTAAHMESAGTINSHPPCVSGCTRFILSLQAHPYFGISE